MQNDSITTKEHKPQISNIPYNEIFDYIASITFSMTVATASSYSTSYAKSVANLH